MPVKPYSHLRVVAAIGLAAVGAAVFLCTLSYGAPAILCGAILGLFLMSGAVAVACGFDPQEHAAQKANPPRLAIGDQEPLFRDPGYDQVRPYRG